MTSNPASLTLTQEVTRRLQAGYGGLLVTTREQQACYEEIRQAGHPTYRWSVASGLLHLVDALSAQPIQGPGETDLNDPGDLLTGLTAGTLGLPEDAVVILADMGPWLKDPILERKMLEAVWSARVTGLLLVIVQKTDELPATLKGEISFLAHALPTRAASRARAETLLETQRREKKYSFAAVSEACVDNIMGLTSVAQDNALALAIGEAKGLKVDSLNVGTLRKLKEEEIGKRPYLKVLDPQITLDDIIGHEELKRWTGTLRKAFTQKARDAGIKPPKGVAFAGPPGTGKTRFAEAIGGTWGFPVLLFDVASAYSSHLGETEANFADALAVAEACEPCILLVDEVERMFSGGSGEKDGGTSERVLGKFLNWTATKKASVFLVFTSNYPQNVPPALLRKGRLDEIFCLDLPTAEERAAIWAHFIKKSPVPSNFTSADKVDPLVSASEGYSGAEIEAIVDAAVLVAFARDDSPGSALTGTVLTLADLSAELERTKPLSLTMGSAVADMQKWAQANARSTVSVSAPLLKTLNTSPRKVK